MQLLKDHNLPFGISTCYTSANYKDITSEEFYDMIIEAGALFIWFFHYMPVGNDAAPELMPDPEQRKAVYERIRAFRSSKPIFSLDFQNDAEYIGGCIAGGRYYLHINAAGDVDPCVFIHYSNANIHEVSLLDALKSPIFQAYRKGQPFNDNMLRPCPMLENPECLPKMVKRPVPTLPIHSHRKMYSISAINANLMPKRGPKWQISFGMRGWMQKVNWDLIY